MSFPLEPSAWASAMIAGTRTVLGWPRSATSSKSSAWAAVPLIQAASGAGAVRSPNTRLDVPATGASTCVRIRVGGSSRPASMTPTQSAKPMWITSSAAGGICSNFRLAMKAPSSRVMSVMDVPLG